TRGPGRRHVYDQPTAPGDHLSSREDRSDVVRAQADSMKLIPERDRQLPERNAHRRPLSRLRERIVHKDVEVALFPDDLIEQRLDLSIFGMVAADCDALATE